jgi:hypothetical protein
MWKSAAMFVVVGSLFGFPLAVAADSNAPDFGSVMRRAYAAEASNDAARRQWQHDLRQWALNTELNRMGTIGNRLGAKPQHPNMGALFFRPKKPHAYEMLSRMAGDAVPGDRHGQKQMLELYEAMVDEYNANPRVVRYFLPQARIVFLQAAYRVFDGDRFSDVAASQLGLQAVIYGLSQSPALTRSSELTKQASYERYVVGAGSFSLGLQWANEHHDPQMLTELKRLASQALATDLGRSPSSMALDELPCVVYPFAGFSCRDQLRMMRRGL